MYKNIYALNLIMMMEKQTNKLRESRKRIINQGKQSLLGNPMYSTLVDDVYEFWKTKSDINPEDISKHQAPNEELGTFNEKGFEDDVSGSDLDIPGFELNNQQENIGNGDEENNHYSLGGDAHNDLKEDKL